MLTLTPMPYTLTLTPTPTMSLDLTLGLNLSLVLALALRVPLCLSPTILTPLRVATLAGPPPRPLLQWPLGGQAASRDSGSPVVFPPFSRGVSVLSVSHTAVSSCVHML